MTNPPAADPAVAGPQVADPPAPDAAREAVIDGRRLAWGALAGFLAVCAVLLAMDGHAGLAASFALAAAGALLVATWGARRAPGD